jgi:hypothetical protein
MFLDFALFIFENLLDKQQNRRSAAAVMHKNDIRATGKRAPSR